MSNPATPRVLAALAISGVAILSASPASGAPGGSPPSCFGHTATIVGHNHNENIQGTSGSDVIVGLGGNDFIAGNGGDDFICGGVGDDAISGGPGDDMIDGNTGTNRVEFNESTGGVYVNLSAGTASSASDGDDTLQNIEGIQGSPERDRLVGDGSSNIIDGNGGADVIRSAKGDDTIAQELPSGGRVYGGLGTDLFVPSVETSDTTPYPDGVVATLSGHFARSHFGPHQTTKVFQIENIDGTGGKDILRGDSRANILSGNGGSDRLFGRGGKDNLFGDFSSPAKGQVSKGDFANGGQGRDVCVAPHKVSCERS